MNKSFLNKLLRRRHGKSAELPDAASLAALVADGPVSNAQRARARVAQSPRNADLYRFARDLQPASEQLSRDLRARFAAANAPAGHRFAHRAARGRMQSRVWRWTASAAAASLVLVAGLWVVHRYDHQAARSAHTVATGKTPSDRIFAALNDKMVAVGEPRQGDVIFRSDFRGTVDGGTKRNKS